MILLVAFEVLKSLISIEWVSDDRPLGKSQPDIYE